MAAPDETPGRAAEPALPSQAPNGQVGPGVAEEARKQDDRPGRKASLFARFLENLRITLSAPHV